MLIISVHDCPIGQLRISSSVFQPMLIRERCVQIICDFLIFLFYSMVSILLGVSSGCLDAAPADAYIAFGCTMILKSRASACGRIIHRFRFVHFTEYSRRFVYSWSNIFSPDGALSGTFTR